MILGADLHQFDVHSDGYFAHLPLNYVDGVILEMSVPRMPVSDDRSTSYMFDVEETFGRLNLYLNHLDMNLSEYLSQAITYDIDDLVFKKTGPPKKRYCNELFVDEMVDWAEMEVETDGVAARNSTTEGVEARNSTTEGVEARNSVTKGVEARNSATEGVEARIRTKDMGKEKVSEDASDVVETRRCTVEVDTETEYESDDESDYQSDKSVVHKEVVQTANNLDTTNQRGPVRDEGASGTRGGAIGFRGRGAGGSGGASGSRGRGITGSRGGASWLTCRGAGGSKRKPVSTAETQKRQGKKKVGTSGFAKWFGLQDEPEQSQDEPENTQAEPQQTQHVPEQTQVEDQVEQTEDQAEIDLTQVEQNQRTNQVGNGKCNL
ncbi:hypothetical protein Tco_0491675 [Tanacetum coccineum]